MDRGGRGFHVYILSVLAVGLLSLAERLPFSLLSRVGGALGTLFYRIDGRRKRIGLENLRLALGGEKNDSERRSILKSVYRNMGKSLFEFAAIPRLTPADLNRLVRFEGLEHLEKAEAAGRGILLLSAHFGNWELTAQSLALAGHPGYAVGRQANVGLLHNYIVRCREAHGNRIIVRGHAARKTFRVLRNGGILGILCDQRGSTSRGLMIDFFGHPAPTNPDVARIVLGLRPSVIMCFGIRNLDGTHTIFLSPPLQYSPSGNGEEDLLMTSRLYMKELEEMIRKYPEQWLWMHRRWMSRSGGAAAVTRDRE